MRTALYYPHTEVKSEALLKSALLTWDQLEYIVPSEEYTPHYASSDMAEAMEIIGQPRTPREDDKREVHKLLEDLISGGVPQPFAYNASGVPGYELWPQKLMPATWSLLREHHLIGPLLQNADYPTTAAAGLTIMSMIADVMAGETRARVTDQGLAYATIANAPIQEKVDTVTSESINQIIALTFKTVATDKLDLRKLIELRRREAKSKGHHYRTLRHLYLDAIEDHIREASKYLPGSRDREEMDRVFSSKMEDDLRDLKDELGFARSDALLSKDTMTFVLAGGALIAAGAWAAVVAAPLVIPAALTLSGAPATVGGVLAVANKYASDRKELLRKHPMAYLYELGE